jgi:hypothetical protein
MARCQRTCASFASLGVQLRQQGKSNTSGMHFYKNLSAATVYNSGPAANK